MKKYLFILFAFYAQLGVAQVLYIPYFQEYITQYEPEYHAKRVKGKRSYVSSGDTKILVYEQKYNTNGYTEEFTEYSPKNGKIAYQAKYYYGGEVDSCIEIMTPFNLRQKQHTHALEPNYGVEIPLFKDKDSNLVMKSIFRRIKDTIFVERFQRRTDELYKYSYILGKGRKTLCQLYVSPEKQLEVILDTLIMQVATHEPLLLSIKTKPDIESYTLNIKYELHQNKKRISQIVFILKMPYYGEFDTRLSIIDVYYNPKNEVAALTRKITSKKHGVNSPNGGILFIYTDTIPLKEKTLLVANYQDFSFLREDYKQDVYHKVFFKDGLLIKEDAHDKSKALIGSRTFNEVVLSDKIVWYGHPKSPHPFPYIFPEEQKVEQHFEYTYW